MQFLEIYPCIVHDKYYKLEYENISPIWISIHDRMLNKTQTSRKIKQIIIIYNLITRNFSTTKTFLKKNKYIEIEIK